MTMFQKITQSPETLAAFLSELAVLSSPWENAFHNQVCSFCKKSDCDDCTQPERGNILWWLGLEVNND